MIFTLRLLMMFITLLFIWQAIVSGFQLPDYLLPTPSQVFHALINQHDVILNETLPTLMETVLGFLLGIIAGCTAGIILAFFRRAALWFLPLLIISQAIPTFAIAPVLVIWLGYGISSKIVMTILMIFFPIASAMYDGLRRTEPLWLDLAKTMNASKWRTFIHIRLPAALPALASGIRIAAVSAPIGAVIGEWVGSSHGLGYLMLNANARLQIDMMFAALIVIILLALGLYFSVDKIMRKLIWWQV